jgi:hypothetical protein
MLHNVGRFLKRSQYEIARDSKVGRTSCMTQNCVIIKSCDLILNLIM